MASLKEVLTGLVREGELVEPLPARGAGWVRCVACGHECPIPDGQAGVCKVRFNRGGTLYVP
ncbi:MAG: AmmeMemoRadiSam system radical SAM enzyme, partial [Terriglobia bacterium]